MSMSMMRKALNLRNFWDFKPENEYIIYSLNILYLILIY